MLQNRPRKYEIRCVAHSFWLKLSEFQIPAPTTDSRRAVRCKWPCAGLAHTVVLR